MPAEENLSDDGEDSRAVEYDSRKTACAEQRLAEILLPQGRKDVEEHCDDQQDNAYAYRREDNGVRVLGVHDLHRLFLKAEGVEHGVEQVLEAEHRAEDSSEYRGGNSAREEYPADLHLFYLLLLLLS